MSENTIENRDNYYNIPDFGRMFSLDVKTVRRMTDGFLPGIRTHDGRIFIDMAALAEEARAEHKALRQLVFNKSVDSSQRLRRF
jgi:hypothetical protein